MSGIYVKGMEMPTTCFECSFMFARRYCCADLTLDLYQGDYEELQGRVDGCPLVLVPPHGRLIDADALGEILEKYKTKYVLKAKEDIVHLHKAWGLYEAELMAESLPTIIPADPAKEGAG